MARGQRRRGRRREREGRTAPRPRLRLVNGFLANRDGDGEELSPLFAGKESRRERRRDDEFASKQTSLSLYKGRERLSVLLYIPEASSPRGYGAVVAPAIYKHTDRHYGPPTSPPLPKPPPGVAGLSFLSRRIRLRIGLPWIYGTWVGFLHLGWGNGHNLRLRGASICADLLSFMRRLRQGFGLCVFSLRPSAAFEVGWGRLHGG